MIKVRILAKKVIVLVTVTGKHCGGKGMLVIKEGCSDNCNVVGGKGRSVGDEGKRLGNEGKNIGD